MLNFRNADTVVNIKHLMIDLETWSLQPNAQIAEFACIGVDKNFKEIGSFSCLIEDSLQGTGHIDQATYEWHSTSTMLIARTENKFNYTWNMIRLLESLNSLLNSLPSDTLIWCQGTDFDIPVLKMAAYHHSVTLKFPQYRNTRDLRTFLATAEMTGWKYPIDKPKTTHEALDDCIKQLKLLESSWKFIANLAGETTNVTKSS